MKLALCVLVAAAILTPLAEASRTGPEPYRRPHVASALEQHAAIAALTARGQPVYCGSPRGNAVALTFDDGPGPYSEQILSILRTANARATFFLVGNRLQYWPRAAREDAALGAVGNHTWSHPHLPALPRWLVWLELVRTAWAERASDGFAPTMFRAPYEERSAMTDRVVADLGMLQVFWSVDSGDDARHAQSRRVVATVLAGLHPGAIVLLHELHPWTVAALPQILDAIRLRGLRAVTVPELLALQPPAREQGCAYPAAGTPGD